MVANHTTVLLGLTAATSLILLSTALPVVIPYDASSSSSAVPSRPPPSSFERFYAQDTFPPKPRVDVEDLKQHGGLGRNTQAFQDILLLTRRPPHTTSAPISRYYQEQEQQQEEAPIIINTAHPSTRIQYTPPPSPPSPHSPLPPQHHQHQHDLLVQTFKPHGRSHGPITPQDQILHQCTTHFLALLDTEISDRLMAQLSRLVMMLPVIGVETRAVIRTKAVETMQQIVGDSGSSSRGGGGGGRLTHYESILRVIRTAVGDAGLLTPTPSSSSSSSSQSWLISNVATTGARNANNRHSRTTMDDLMVLADDGRNEQVSEYDDVGDISNINNNINSSSNSNGGGGGDSEIDESQIPVIADIAMEAVLDYMAEILTPSLVIHQMTEAIQDALFEISKQRTTLQRARNQRGISNDGGDKDDNSSDLEDLNDGDFDLNDFSSSSSSSRSSQSAGTATKAADRHGVDLLSDGWVWSEPSSSRDRNSLLSLEDDYYGEEDEGRGQDEDLWDKDMEIHQWDSAGRLFEDFEENDILDDNMADEFSTSFQTVMSKTKQEDMENWDVPAAAAGDDEDDEDSDPYTIGIWESDEGGRGDSEDAEEDNETTTVTSGGSSSEEYGRGREASPRQSYFNRFQKRALFTPDNTAASTSVESNSATPQSSSAKPIDNNAKAAATTTTTSPIRNTIRRPNITPDLRLENLLTQLIEPLLTTFIEEDFPASCKRVQGELMDGIIWSLDQTELNSDGLSSDEERMLLLSELEY